ncbi:MAG: FtsQ-type POTRA domain-containing protein [Proteobacteria bacterium]|nr:FtsQ-type POTRA domain-containing protein [Pseudomonadota bacterium]MBU1388625.1 FtsQ-type POTRA domain-containing protein [Pseudomonadota bacterium]MBU1541781.1 FtsQ-type POTRA domain-containing protein [Pseudomonadota bacterium]MBU2479893.1 FtsQ-type POTRA domain-containing protein [Pseudomonadota bacterium]
MSKKIKPNRYRPEPGNVSEGLLNDSGDAIDFCLKCIMIVAFISILSLASIFIYDFFTQSSFFNIKNIKISGLDRVEKQDIMSMTGLTGDENIFSINVFTLEKQIASHPWVQSVRVKRHLESILSISIVEQTPLAIVRIENLSDILINTQGTAFKEYDPENDRISNLPIITGLDLTAQEGQYRFHGPLFDAIMTLLNMKDINPVTQIKGDPNTGIIVDIIDTYNRAPENSNSIISIKLGFDDFKAKLDKAGKISRYIGKNFPDKAICAMDLFNLHKVFIKTKMADTLHTNFEKGV